jgi:hypothetical protein
MSFKIGLGFHPRSDETVLHTVHPVWWMTSKALPSYRAFFSLPPLMSASLVVTTLRIVVVASLFGLRIQEFYCWHRGQALPDDPEIIQSVGTGRSRFLGECLEVVTHHPARLKYLNFLCAPRCELRFYTRKARILAETIASLQQG